MYLLNCFFIYSFLGFIVEASFNFLLGHSFSSGILYGPWTPVYGFGAVLIIIISEKLFKNLHMNRFKETIIVFFAVTIILSVLEWLGGVLIEYLFNTTFWNYSDYKYNLGKYVTLEMSLLWGIMSIIFIYIIKPFLDSMIKKLPKWLSLFVLILFFIDVVVTFLLKQ